MHLGFFQGLLGLRQGTHGGGRVTFLLSGCVMKVALPDLEKRSPVMTDGCAVPSTPVLAGATRSRLHLPVCLLGAAQSLASLLALPVGVFFCHP